MQEIGTKLLQSKFPELLKQFSGKILNGEEAQGMITVTVEPSSIREVVSFLKKDPNHNFDVLMDLFAIDYDKFPVPQPERFCVVYSLFSMFQKGRIFLKAFVAEGGAVPSLHEVYAAANWFEREAWDLYGIGFTGHPNLVRILCHNEFVGHPLRKDYPSAQYQQLRKASPSSGF